MKLYYAPGACSLSPHIVLREAGLDFDLVRVDLRSHLTETGEDYYAVNPKGSVPALQLDDGTLLTEGGAIVQYIADHHAPSLVPANGTLARTRLQEMLSFLSADYHKSYSPLFNPVFPEETKAFQRGVIARRQAYLDKLLGDNRPFLMGDTFSVADAYFFTVTGWSAHVGVPLDAFPNITAFMARIAERDTVKAALAAEAGAH